MPRYPILIDRVWASPLALFGADHQHSFLDMQDDSLHASFGQAQQSFPLSQIESVRRHEWSLFYGIGLRLGYEGVGYIGSKDKVVQIILKAPVSFNVFLGFHKEASNFYVSLEDPDEFILEVQARISTAH